MKEPSRPAHAAEWARRFGLYPELIPADNLTFGESVFEKDHSHLLPLFPE